MTGEQRQALVQIAQKLGRDISAEVSIPASLVDLWKAEAERNGPKAKSTKALIFAWISGWPGVLIFMIFHDLVNQIVEFIYRYVGRFFDSVTADEVNKFVQK